MYSSITCKGAVYVPQINARSCTPCCDSDQMQVASSCRRAALSSAVTCALGSCAPSCIRRSDRAGRRPCRGAWARRLGRRQMRRPHSWWVLAALALSFRQTCTILCRLSPQDLCELENCVRQSILIQLQRCNHGWVGNMQQCHRDCDAKQCVGRRQPLGLSWHLHNQRLQSWSCKCKSERIERRHRIDVPYGMLNAHATCI